MRKKIKKDDNFLELIPKKNPNYQWIEKEDGLLQIIVPRDRLLDKVVRVIFKTSRQFTIHADSFGSFVLKNINVERNVEEFVIILRKKFGDEIEPLYKRLVTFLNTLRDNKFITLEKAGD